MSVHTSGRRRTLDRTKKTEICDHVARGATVSEAAVGVGVSIRTIQREARRDPDFDQRLRDAQCVEADPRLLMKKAARTHWRAAAWLLERTDPENYGRRSPSSCSPRKFDDALTIVVEAALAGTPAAERPEMYERLSAACEAAFKSVFPTYGPFGGRIKPAKFDTPLADALRRRRQWDRAVPDYDDPTRQIEIPIPAAAKGASPLNGDERQPRAGGGDAPARCNSNPNPTRTPNPNPLPADPNPLPPPDERLPWSYNHRASQTPAPAEPSPAASPAPRDAAVLSPKTPFATEQPGDRIDPVPLNGPSRAAGSNDDLRGSDPPPRSACADKTFAGIF